MPPRAAPEVRAAAIAQWMAGERVTTIAEKLNLRPPTIYNWVSGLERGGALVNRGSEQSISQKKTGQRIDLDVVASDLIHDSVQALHDLYSQATDKTWRDKQSGSDLAVFAGVIADKLLRVLGAIDRAALAAQQQRT